MGDGVSDDLKIGIMADSHGLPETISRALAFFRRQGCRTVYHLGDICDSLDDRTLVACVRLLKDHSVIALKGNNDHVQTIRKSEGGEPSDRSAARAYLTHLPLRVEAGRGIFAHSLPFIKELGLSALTGPLEGDMVERILDRIPDRVLFRGHSHSPEIHWREAGVLRSQRIEAGQTLGLGRRLSCIVTCGALTRGFCMVWWPHEMAVSCHLCETK